MAIKFQKTNKKMQKCNKNNNKEYIRNLHFTGKQLKGWEEADKETLLI